MEQMKVNVNGPIVSDSHAWIYKYFNEPHTSPSIVTDFIDEAEGKDITVVINSGGGSVYAASEIYYALKSYTGKVRIEIGSIAASAASFIAMAGDEVLISPIAQIMIHNSSSYASGDYREMDKTSDMLKATNRSISRAYELRTGLSKERLKAMMDKEVYLTAEESIELGFADNLLFTEDEDIVANQGELLPKSVIKNMMSRMEKGEFFKGDNQKSNTKPKNQTGGEEKLTYEEIKNKYPETFNKIKNEGIEKGEKQERERIKSIDALSQAGMEDLLNKAKYEQPINAGELAIEILNEQRKINDKRKEQIENDANELKKVTDRSIDNENDEKEKALINDAQKTLENAYGGGVL